MMYYYITLNVALFPISVHYYFGYISIVFSKQTNCDNQKSSFIGLSNVNDNRKGGIHFYTGNLFRSSGVKVEKILSKRSRLLLYKK